MAARASRATMSPLGLWRARSARGPISQRPPTASTATRSIAWWPLSRSRLNRGARSGILGLSYKPRHRRHRGEPGRRAGGAPRRPGFPVTSTIRSALPAASAVLGDKATRPSPPKPASLERPRGHHDALAAVPEHSSQRFRADGRNRLRCDRLLARPAQGRASVRSRMSCTSASATIASTCTDAAAAKLESRLRHLATRPAYPHSRFRTRALRWKSSV